MGIEPTQPAWKAGALPLSYTRGGPDNPPNQFLPPKLKNRAPETNTHRLYNQPHQKFRHRRPAVVEGVGFEPT